MLDLSGVRIKFAPLLWKTHRPPVFMAENF